MTWDSGELLPEQAAGLPPAALQRALLRDMECRWERGQRVRAGEYPGLYPAATITEDMLHALVVRECEFRHEMGVAPPIPPEYFQAFPNLAERLWSLREAWEGLPNIPGYTIEGVLGEGGVGIVYRAIHHRLERTCAVKMIAPRLLANGQTLARFQAEAKVLGKLAHPHIVQIFDVDAFQGRPFMALEYCPDALDRALKSRPLPPDDAARLVRTLALAVAAAHAAGVIHRDLKPANVLLAADGTPKITDFGLARRLDQVGVTQPGTVLGTPAYMAPEQARGQGELGPAVDVYALGAVLYECLIGRPPFSAATVGETLLQVATMQPVGPRVLNPGVPRDLETICLKCLRKNPSQRYASAQELADDLQRLLERKPIRARPEGRLERGWRFVKEHRLGVAAAALVLACLLAAVGLYFWGTVSAKNRELTQEREKTRGALTLANAEAQRANGLNRQLERSLTMNQIDRALAAAAGHNRLGALRLLPRDPLYAGQWEWHHVRGLCSGEDRVLPAHRKSLAGLAFAKDGGRLVTAGREGSIRVWDAATFKEVARFDDLPGLFAVAPLPEGERWLTVAGQWDDAGRRFLSGAAQVRDLGGAGAVTALAEAQESFLAVAVRPGGKQFATSSTDLQITIRDAGTGAVVRRWDAGPRRIEALRYSPDGATLASAAAEYSDAAAGYLGGRVTLWDAETGAEVRNYQGAQRGILALDFSPDGALLAAGGDERDVLIWKVGEGERPEKRLPRTLSIVGCLAFSGDGKRLAVGTGRWDGKRFSGGYAELWDCRTWTREWELRGHDAAVTHLAFAPEGRQLLTGALDGTVHCWPLPFRQERADYLGHAVASEVAASPEGGVAASVGADGAVHLWEIPTARPLRKLEGNTTASRTVAFAADGRTILNGAHDGRLTLREVGGRELWRRENGASVLSARLAPGGTLAAAGCRDGRVNLWTVPPGPEPTTLRGHTGTVLGVSFSPDGRYLASVGEDRVVRVWDTARQSLHRELRGHTDSVNAVAFSPDGQLLATAGGDQCVVLWSVATWQEVRRLRGHEHWVVGVAFSPDGKRLATASADRTVRLWDPESGDEVLKLVGHRERVSSVAFSADGEHLLTACFDGIVKVWSAPGAAARR